MNNLSNEKIFAENLQYYMRLNDKTRFNICRDLCLPYTTLAQWYTGKSYPRIEHIEKLANYFHIRKSDLIEDKNQSDNINNNIIEIPILKTLKIHYDYLSQENWIGTINIDKKLLNKQTLFALRIEEDSMSPVLLENDIIIVSRQNDFNTDDIVVAIDKNGKLLIRKAVKSNSCVIFQAFNLNYETLVFNYNDMEYPTVIGIVKQLQRNFKRRHKTMYLIYADESGNTGTDYDNKEQPIFVIAGVLINDDIWHKTNNYFNKKKIEILPILENAEIHTNELFNSSKKSIFNQFDWQTNFLTLEKLVDLILELDISVYYIAIDKKSFKKGVNIVFNNTFKVDPYIYSFGMLYDNISSILHKKGQKGLVFLDDILTIPSQLHNIYPILSKNNFTMIEEAMFINSQNTNFIQIADIFAFYIERYFSITKGYKNYSEIKEKHCLAMYEKLSKKISTIGSEFLTTYIPFKPKEYYI